MESLWHQEGKKNWVYPGSRARSTDTGFLGNAARPHMGSCNVLHKYVVALEFAYSDPGTGLAYAQIGSPILFGQASSPAATPSTDYAGQVPQSHCVPCIRI